MELTLTGVGAAILTEGIKFLYGQAGEVLKRWRERGDTAAGETDARTTAPIAVEAPTLLEGELERVEIDFDAVGSLEQELKGLRAALLEYAEGEPVDPGDQDVVRTADALRRILEVIYGQRITFKGEERAPSGPVAEGEIDVESVRGYAAGLRVGTMTGGHARGNMKANTVERDAEGIGLDVKRLG